jgi:hypothetical protein
VTPHSVLPKALRRPIPGVKNRGQRRLRLSIIGLGVRRTGQRFSKRRWAFLNRAAHATALRGSRLAKLMRRAAA